MRLGALPIAVRCNRLLAGTVMPVIMAFSTLLPVVCNLKTNTIRAFEKGCRVVARVLWIQPWFCGVNSERAKLTRYRLNVGRGIDTQAKVMQPRGVRIVFCGRAGRP